MSDSFNEKISQFIDDEMSVEEGEFFVRRLQSDEDARRRYLRYQLIGAAVRGDYRDLDAAEFDGRGDQTLESHARPTETSGWVPLAGGVGIVAALVFVAVFGLGGIQRGQQAPADTGSRVASIGAPDVQSFVGTPAQVTGIQYRMLHANFTSGLNRTIMRSSVIVGQDADPNAAIDAGLVTNAE